MANSIFVVVFSESSIDLIDEDACVQMLSGAWLIHYHNIVQVRTVHVPDNNL